MSERVIDLLKVIAKEPGERLKRRTQAKDSSEGLGQRTRAKELGEGVRRCCCQSGAHVDPSVHPSLFIAANEEGETSAYSFARFGTETCERVGSN